MSRIAAGLPVTALTVATALAAWWLANRPAPVATPALAAVSGGRAAEGDPAFGGGLAGDAAACAECHRAEFAAWSDSPHARTLVAADDPGLVRLAEATPDRAEGSRLIAIPDGLAVESPRMPDPVRIAWIFGSGVHARTPVSTWLDPQGRTVMLEHSVSWYPPGFLAATLGSREPNPGPGLLGCGKLLDPETTRSCFGCHATRVPQRAGRVDEAAVAAGVGCVRCHPDADRHAAAARAARTDPPPDRWARLTPLESIRACGECHRRDDQLPADDLRPDNLLLVRFAPVGLAQSACFTRQAERRLDCLTCHDPHLSADRRPLAAATRCGSCHGPAGDHPSCPAAPAGSDCTACHMPKVEVQPHLLFTDHWIRVREGGGEIHAGDVGQAGDVRLPASFPR